MSSSGQDATLDGASASTLPSNIFFRPRMCTVSHCREILSGDYQFLRCEKHRVQNRHHSKLKRVRDKKSKATAYGEWTALATAVAPGHAGAEANEVSDAGASEEERNSDERYHADDLEDRDRAAEAELREALLQKLGPSASLADTRLGEPSTGVPPAARGSRRTNHVCSIRACYNLLSPSNPWKMCDPCRARDRAGRREKALRGDVVDKPKKRKASPEGDGDGTTKKKTRRKRKKRNGENADDDGTEGPPGSTIMQLNSLFTTVPLRFATQEVSVADSAQPNSSGDTASRASPPKEPSNVIFMEPLLPEGEATVTTLPSEPSVLSTSAGDNSTVSFI